jgi:hypothetical protein
MDWYVRSPERAPTLRRVSLTSPVGVWREVQNRGVSMWGLQGQMLGAWLQMACGHGACHNERELGFQGRSYRWCAEGMHVPKMRCGVAHDTLSGTVWLAVYL